MTHPHFSGMYYSGYLFLIWLPHRHFAFEYERFYLCYILYDLLDDQEQLTFLYQCIPERLRVPCQPAEFVLLLVLSGFLAIYQLE